MVAATQKSSQTEHIYTVVSICALLMHKPVGMAAARAIPPCLVCLPQVSPSFILTGFVASPACPKACGHGRSVPFLCAFVFDCVLCLCTSLLHAEACRHGGGHPSKAGYLCYAELVPDCLPLLVQKPVGMVAATQQGTLSQSFFLALDVPMEDMATLAAAGSSNLSGGSTQSTYTGTAEVLRRPVK